MVAGSHTVSLHLSSSTSYTCETVVAEQCTQKSRSSQRVLFKLPFAFSDTFVISIILRALPFPVITQISASISEHTDIPVMITSVSGMYIITFPQEKLACLACKSRGGCQKSKIVAHVPDLIKCGQMACIIESCPHLASGTVNKTHTGHLLPSPPANHEIFETSSKSNLRPSIGQNSKNSQDRQTKLYIFHISIKFRVDYTIQQILKIFQKFHNQQVVQVTGGPWEAYSPYRRSNMGMIR